MVADMVMGLDNVIGVAGAAHGNFVLVVLGLLISIPVLVWGSSLFLSYLERFPALVYVGAAVLALTAAKMMTSEPLVREVLSRFAPAAPQPMSRSGTRPRSLPETAFQRWRAWACRWVWRWSPRRC